MVKVSVVMSIYNESKHEIVSAVNSILDQTFKDFEFIIINDNPDRLDLKNILDEVKGMSDKIIVLDNIENRGLAYSLNRGIEKARGLYIARMDSDDMALSNRLEMENDYLDEHPDVIVVSGNCDYIDGNDNKTGVKSRIPITNRQISKLLPVGSDIIHPTVMMRKKEIKKLGIYRDFPTAEDYDLWLRCLSNNYKFGAIDKVLLHYRIRNSSMTHSDPLLLFLVENYQRSLFDFRNKNGIDNYSVKNLKEYLELNNYNNRRFKSQYEKGEEYFQKFITEIKNRKVMKSLVNLIKSFCSTNLNRKRIILFFKYELVSFKIKRG